MMLRTETRRNLQALGITPDRKLGQNFLVNPSVSSRIAGAVPRHDSTLEIGPGLGSLTEKLADRCDTVTLVELSKKMSDFLRMKFSGKPVHVVNGDFLSIDPMELPGFPFSTIAGNLPYSISSPILFRLLEDAFSEVETAVIMLQREVAQRVTALDGGRDYGRLSLQIWPKFSVEVLLDASPEDFYPAPEVMSRVIVLKRRPEALLSGEEYVRFRRLVRISFSMRRKTILNNMKAAFGRDGAMDLLERAGIDPGLRAEQLSPQDFAKIAEMA
jgi:16S rRNA (adenine1518-N6/adenine1519-N6)-dimethyltransferase